jgi:hypothetical protein
LIPRRMGDVVIEEDKKKKKRGWLREEDEMT